MDSDNHVLIVEAGDGIRDATSQGGACVGRELPNNESSDLEGGIKSLRDGMRPVFIEVLHRGPQCHFYPSDRTFHFGATGCNPFPPSSGESFGTSFLDQLRSGFVDEAKPAVPIPECGRRGGYRRVANNPIQ
jgi:hypothetical protein